MVCNRSEWLQNRELLGTILPIETIRAGKEKIQKEHKPWDVPVHCKAYIAPLGSIYACNTQTVVVDKIQCPMQFCSIRSFDSVFENIVVQYSTCVHVLTYQSSVPSCNVYTICYNSQNCLIITFCTCQLIVAFSMQHVLQVR